MASLTPPPPASFLLAQQAIKSHQSQPQQSAGDQPLPQQHPTYLSSAMLFLDITTFQGLLLYTLYLLHRLRFFRWRDARALSQILVGAHRSLELDTKNTSTTSSSTHTTSPAEVETQSQEEGCCSSLSLDSSTPSLFKGTHRSINERLPPEILTLVFEQVARPRTILRCMLVCREWYHLLGPRIWKSPRVLWSRHWSRFFPHSDIVTTGLLMCEEDDLEVARVTPQRQLTSPLQEQQYRQRQYNSPAEALASGQLHDLDRQEMERWLEWKKRERIRRLREMKRRRQQLARRSRGRGIGGALGKGRGDDEDTEDGDWDSFDEHDASDGSLDSESEAEYDTEEDETALMKVISGIDYLRTLLHPEHGNGSNPAASQRAQQQPSGRSRKALRLFSTVLAHARQQQALRECRSRLASIKKSDGLPASLPLSTCGQWIQVINLQQETSFPQPTSPQSFMHPPPLSSRARQQRSHTQHAQQPLLDPVAAAAAAAAPRGFLASFFGVYARNRADLRSTLDASSEPARLRSRRDDISDRSLQTILDSCPGLCRLTLSECHGITDAGMRMIHDSACVAQGTLVSLHMAGCHQITDQGLFYLLGLQTNNSNKKDYHHHNHYLSHASDDCPRQPRFESLDLAGCYGVTDQGLIPVLEQCGAKLTQLRVSDCEGVTQRSVEALAQQCPGIQWLDLARTGVLTTECLLRLAERCSDLEWLNLARTHASDLETAEAEAAAVEGEAQDLEDQDIDDDDDVDDIDDGEDDGNEGGFREGEGSEEEDSISDHAISVLCEWCPKLQLLDLSYIPTVTNAAIEALSESAQSLVCLTIIGCPGITSQSLVHLAKLRRSSGKLGCITMGDALGISERDIEEIMQGTLSGWQKSLVDETNLGEILGRSWDE